MVIGPAAAGTRLQLPEGAGPLQVSPLLAVTATSPVAVPSSLVTAKPTTTASPGADGSGASDVMLVLVCDCSTVIVGCSASVTSPAVAVTVLVPAAEDSKLNFASPFPSVVADGGSIVLPSPVTESVTAIPSSVLPFASRTTTLTSV